MRSSFFDTVPVSYWVDAPPMTDWLLPTLIYDWERFKLILLPSEMLTELLCWMWSGDQPGSCWLPRLVLAAF